jgi:tetratricopeptide (TPR) repeat protein
MVEAKSYLDTAVTLKESESELLYFRGLINYCLENPVDAIPDLDAAIDKAEDNMAKHFIARGKCYAVLKLYKEALQEFSIAL